MNQWCHRAGAVEPVAFDDLRFQLSKIGDGMAAGLKILGTAPGSLLRCGREKHLQLGVGEHGRPDVAAFGHQPASFTEPLLLLRQQLPNAGMGRHQRNRAGDLGISDGIGHILAIDANGLHTVLQRREVNLKTVEKGLHG